MDSEAPKAARKKIVEFEQVKSKLLTPPVWIGLTLTAITWVALAAGGWFVYHQNSLLKQQLANVSNQETSAVSPSQENTAAVKALLQRINFLENQITQLSMQMAQNPTAQNGENVTVAEIPADMQQHFSEMQTQITETRQMVQALQQQRGASALLVAVITLRDAVDRGAAYSHELAALATLTKGDMSVEQSIKLLQPNADKGVATISRLKETFQDIITPALRASKPQSEGNEIVRWAKDNLAEVVKVRRIGKDVAGSSTEAILARAEYFINQGDIPSALTELKAIQGEATASVQPWVEAAELYLRATKTADNLYRRIITPLSASSS